MIRNMPALALLRLCVTSLWATDCTTTEGNDAMQYDQKNIEVPRA
ncbi:hypothetical protein [Dyella sp. ASV21]|nr:hypothetical protein [Dyella sp. ASV21]